MWRYTIKREPKTYIQAGWGERKKDTEHAKRGAPPHDQIKIVGLSANALLKNFPYM